MHGKYLVCSRLFASERVYLLGIFFSSVLFDCVVAVVVCCLTMQKVKTVLI